MSEKSVFIKLQLKANWKGFDIIKAFYGVKASTYQLIFMTNLEHFSMVN